MTSGGNTYDVPVNKLTKMLHGWTVRWTRCCYSPILSIIVSPVKLLPGEVSLCPRACRFDALDVCLSVPV